MTIGDVDRKVNATAFEMKGLADRLEKLEKEVKKLSKESNAKSSKKD